MGRIVAGETVSVRTRPAYDIHIAPGLLGESLWYQAAVTGRAFIAADAHAFDLHGRTLCAGLAAAGIAYEVYRIAGGEAAKCADMLFALVRALAASRYTRTDTLIAFGGGVTGDLAGFAAATYMRGMPYVQIPTTLLAQVDSSVGGKTAIDLPEGKNLMGAFYQPRAVLIDPNVLDTLDDANFACGMAEMIKYALIADAALLARIQAAASRQLIRGDLPGLIARSVCIKRDFVEQDERDQGQRMALNFGHTLAHALEKTQGFGTLPHGYAVGLGMAHMLRLAGTPGADAALACMERFGIPTYAVDVAPLLNSIRADKKSTSRGITLVLVPEIGRYELKTVSFDELSDVLGGNA
ncbi:MAG: 3-dehydroquinate synthase [Eubacteriales bacterium]|nr:3-dehydroquinate synthase [Eubacteriales bacterium]